MRVLNTQTLDFEEINDSDLDNDKTEYAILSHRWGKEEVSLRDMLLPNNKWRDRKASAKIRGFCKLAASMGYQYGWVDTCCINKETSHELSEAINSMYYWYKCSTVCIVYLQDVPLKRFEDSSWFDRGWTLQELIAPKVVMFFDKNWTIIDFKSGLIETLARKTGIPNDVLEHKTSISARSVAERMSWAAHRTTTRIEDRAYSLMGLFDVNMPMIYGERERAFLRLQQHIIQQTKDESIFAWDMEAPGETRAYSGLLARSPSAFANCKGIIQSPGSHGFSEMNGELSLRLKLVPGGMRSYYAVLNCTDTNASRKGNCSILIADTGTTVYDGVYVRIKSSRYISRKSIPENSEDRLNERQIRVPLAPSSPPPRRYPGFWLRKLQPPGHEDCQTIMWSNTPCLHVKRMCQDDFIQDITGIVHLKPKVTSTDSDWYQIRWITLGFDADFNPIMWIANHKHSDQIRDKFGKLTSSTAGSKSEELDRELIQKPCKHDGVMEWPSDKDPKDTSVVERGWPTGSHIVRMKYPIGGTFTISQLNLKIVIELLIDSTIATTSDNASPTHEVEIIPTLTWAIEITDTGGENPDERVKRQNRQSLEQSRADTRINFMAGVILFAVVFGFIGLLTWLNM